MDSVVEATSKLRLLISKPLQAKGKGVSQADFNSLSAQVQVLAQVLLTVAVHTGTVDPPVKPGTFECSRTEVDELVQRSLRGTLVISGDARVCDAKRVVPSAKKVRDDKLDLRDVAADLLNRKFAKVRGPSERLVDPSDFSSVKISAKGNIVAQVSCSKSNGDAWESVRKLMYKMPDTSFPAFVNFSVTKARNEILLYLRQLRKDGKIHKFYTDHNGQISFRVSEQAPKIRCTYHPNGKGLSHNSTEFTKAALSSLIDSQTSPSN